MAFKGGRLDVDKEVDEMNEEEKAVFEVLQKEQGDEYQELDDDFILMLNGGIPSSKEEKKEEQIKEYEMPDKNNNAGVFVVSGTDG